MVHFRRGSGANLLAVIGQLSSLKGQLSNVIPRCRDGVLRRVRQRDCLRMKILPTTTKDSDHWPPAFPFVSLLLIAALSSSCQTRQSEPTSGSIPPNPKIESKEQQNTDSPNAKTEPIEQQNPPGVTRSCRYNVPELGGDVVLLMFQQPEGISASQQVESILDVIRPAFPKSPFKAIILQQERSGLISATPSYVFMRRGNDFRQDASQAELSTVIKALGNTQIK